MFTPTIGQSYDTITVDPNRIPGLNRLNPDYYIVITYPNSATIWCSEGNYAVKTAERLIDAGTGFVYEYRMFTERQARYLSD